MADENKITMELDLESSEFQAKLHAAGYEVKKLGEDGKKSFEGVGHSALELNAILELGIKAFEITKELFKETIGESVKAAMEEEHAIVGLNLAISNSNWASTEASHSMLELAESMSKSSTFSKDMIASLETQAINLTKTEEQAKKLTKAAVELSAATGKDAATSMQMLAMSMQGMTRGLDKVVPGMKQLSASQLEAGAAADLIIKKFGGSAQAMTETFGGRVQKLKISFEELHESIGKAITQSPVVNRALEGITILIDKVTSRIEDWVKGGGIDGILKAMIGLSQGIITYIISPLELAYNVGKLLFDTMVLGFQTVIAAAANVGGAIIIALVNPVMEGLKIISSAVGLFSEEYEKKIVGAITKTQNAVNETVVGFAQSSTEVMKDASNQVSTDMEKMFDFSFSNQLSKRVEEIQTFFEGAKAPISGLREDLEKTKEATITVSGAFSKMYAGIDWQAKDLAKNAGKNFENLGKQMFNTIGAGAGQAFAAFGKALATGKNALKAFTDSLLGTLGGMAVQTGTQFILQGAAYSWAGMPNGPALMSAGAALAAFGGVLSGLGGGGESTGGSAGAGGSGPATGVASPGSTPAQTATPVKEKQAAIVINGDFLNSRETANHLAEVLRQNSDITDYTITAQGRSYA